MKKSLILLPMAAVLLSLTGCKKDNEKSGPSGETVTFTANIGGGEKTEIYNGTKMKWSDDDKITINGDVFTSEFPFDDDYTTANFVGTFTSTPTAYRAYYPETLHKDGDKYELPATQTYNAENGNVLSCINPMYAYQPDVNNKTLQFHNICALVKLQVTGTGTVKQIVVTSTDNLCGEFSVSDEGGKCHAVIPLEEEGKTLTLNCGIGVTLNETTPQTFYIALPQGELGDLTFKCSGDAGVWTSQPIATANLTAGKLYTKSLENVEFKKPAVFTVDDDKTVEFAPGNLWYDGSAFHFETNQWDTKPAYSEMVGGQGTWDANHVSHFKWSDKANAVTDNENYSGELFCKKDFTVDGNSHTDWRTLSDGEWSYLLNTSGSSGRTDANRFAKAKVNYVCGLLIFPDGYNGTTSGDGIAALNTKNAAYPDDNIPEDTWSSMESSGVVFLPAAGYRYGMDVYNVGSDGFYWCSTSGESDGEAYCMCFNSGNVLTYADFRDSGYAVRLVR